MQERVELSETSISRRYVCLSVSVCIGTGSLHTGAMPTMSVESSMNEETENRRTPGAF